MTKQRDLSCPVCSTDLSIEQLFASVEAQTAFNRLARVSIPMGARVLTYVSMFAPEKNRLTVTRKVKLIEELLPDLERQAINRHGRDWAAPYHAWGLAIEQMEASRQSGRLQLPLTNHAYLYSILQGMADKHERHAESEAEAERRAAPQRGNVQVRGFHDAGGNLADLLMPKSPAVDPALTKIAADSARAAPIPENIREKMAAIKRAATGGTQ